MKEFKHEFVDFQTYHRNERKPDFGNILKVLDRKAPDRATLFEFFLNRGLYENLSDMKYEEPSSMASKIRVDMKAYLNAGYDYVTVLGSDFTFQSKRKEEVAASHGSRTISLNSAATIVDRDSFKRYEWPDPDNYDYTNLDTLSAELPDGMKFIVWGPGGVFENVIELTGYENLCYMLSEDPDLVKDIFDAVGSRFVRYYEICGRYDSVGALISNDDWGFNSQTLLSIKDMRKYVIPWHRKIAKAIHASGKPAILHSCGQLEHVMEDIITDIGYDGKHSYEDKITPVEEAYEKWGGRIAILGGIDLDFVCRSSPRQVFSRSVEMLDRTMKKGSYALGSGNSIPEYVPNENYLAMISAVYE